MERSMKKSPMKKKRSEGFMPYDGRAVNLLNKAGEIILLNIVFLLCCLPVVTVGPALTSLYYATMKSIRRERGYPIREFMNSMRRILGKGILITLLLVLWAGLLLFGRQYAGREPAGTGEWRIAPGTVIYDLFLWISGGVALYIFPVLSRFEMKLAGIVKLSFAMCVRFLPITVLCLAGTAAVGWLMIFVLPIPCILFVPGVWCLGLTFLIERALQAYTKPAEPGEEQWYDKQL